MEELQEEELGLCESSQQSSEVDDERSSDEDGKNEVKLEKESPDNEDGVYDSHFLDTDVNEDATKSVRRRPPIPNKNKICPICNKFFYKRLHLEKHIRTHTGEKPYRCQICSRGFNDSYALKRHKILHTDNRPYICNVCNKGFCAPGDLKKHLVIHSGEKPHICNLCNKGFTQVGHLSSHMLSHTQEKLFSCEVCALEFSYKSSLKKHMRTHFRSGEVVKKAKTVKEKVDKVRDHICSECSKNCRTLSALKQHIRTHIPIVCKICQQVFAERKALYRHEKFYHSEKSSKSTRKSRVVNYNKKESSDQGTNEKNLICEICLKGFTFLVSFRKHMVEHGVKMEVIKCPVCDEVLKNNYKLKKHIQTVHQGSKPFQCPLCIRTFITEYGLTRHQLFHSRGKPFELQFPQFSKHLNTTETIEEVFDENHQEIKQEINDEEFEDYYEDSDDEFRSLEKVDSVKEEEADSIERNHVQEMEPASQTESDALVKNELENDERSSTEV